MIAAIVAPAALGLLSKVPIHPAEVPRGTLAQFLGLPKHEFNAPYGLEDCLDVPQFSEDLELALTQFFHIGKLDPPEFSAFVFELALNQSPKHRREQSGCPLSGRVFGIDLVHTLAELVKRDAGQLARPDQPLIRDQARRLRT